MKRLFDLTLLFVSLPFLCLVFVTIVIAIRINTSGPIFFWSERVGQNNHIFKMPKFCTMRMDTPLIATHLLENPDHWVTPVGSFLRKTSLDELPQVWNILLGEMSFVGPRPALFNQYDLVKLRTSSNVHRLVPGLTGLAQTRGRDELPIEDKVQLDRQYLEGQSLLLDVKIILLTLFKVLKRDGVSH
jgi:O-antigen biosynthesis protein WbqP